MSDQIQKLIQVYNTLDSVTVKGFSNCAAIAASMQILSSVIQEAKQDIESGESDKS